MKSESFVAPGPAIDYIVPTEEEKKKITKEMLLQLAQKNNLLKGKEANEGLQDFVQEQYVIAKSFSFSQDSKKTPGFRAISPSGSPSQLMKRSHLTFSSNFSNTRPVSSHPRPQTHSILRKLHDFKQQMTANLPLEVKRLNKRCILTPEFNKIRAETMGIVKVFMKERELMKPLIECSVYSVKNQVKTVQGKEEMRKLKGELESQLVDRLAAAEIETIKRIERDARYPRLSNSQILEKLGKLKSTTEKGWGPLQEVSEMEVIHMKNRRLR